MLLEETREKLSAMKLRGMSEALDLWLGTAPDRRALDPLDFLGLLVDAEWANRENRKLTRRLQEAKFPIQAAAEDIDYRYPRGLEKARVLDLLSCRWIQAHENIIITGATGLGKTFLPCALGQKACRDGYRVLYTRAPRLFGDLYQARADGSYRRMLQRLAKFDVLIIDDLGTAPLDASQRLDLREILEDRYSLHSTIVTSQFEPGEWHSFIGDETLADAICDRLVHNAHRFRLQGESMRKARNPASREAEPEC